MRGGPVVGRQSHKLEIVGANPTPATKISKFKLQFNIRKRGDSKDDYALGVFSMESGAMSG